MYLLLQRRRIAWNWLRKGNKFIASRQRWATFTYKNICGIRYLLSVITLKWTELIEAYIYYKEKDKTWKRRESDAVRHRLPGSGWGPGTQVSVLSFLRKFIMNIEKKNVLQKNVPCRSTPIFKCMSHLINEKEPLFMLLWNVISMLLIIFVSDRMYDDEV
jgi:hypothetical protein